MVWYCLSCLVCYPRHMDGFCVKCKKTDGPLCNVKEKSFTSLLKYGKDRQNHEILRYLWKNMKNGLKSTVQIHNKCRKNYTNKRCLSQVKLQKKTSSRGKFSNFFVRNKIISEDKFCLDIFNCDKGMIQKKR